MLVTAILSFIAGLLTALAPCVLPLLPIILGGSLSGDKKDKWRPYIITASLAASLILFTLLLKASTVFIGINPRVWTIGSGLLVMLLGFFMLFPDLWVQIIGRLGIEHRSQGLLGKAYKQQNGVLSASTWAAYAAACARESALAARVRVARSRCAWRLNPPRSPYP